MKNIEKIAKEILEKKNKEDKDVEEEQIQNEFRGYESTTPIG